LHPFEGKAAKAERGYAIIQGTVERITNLLSFSLFTIFPPVHP